MCTVKVIIKHVVEEGYNANSKCNTETNNIYKGKDFVFQQIPESYQQVALDHIN
jgi:hypothetical protein